MKEIMKYATSDGTEFNTAQECRNYETIINRVVERACDAYCKSCWHYPHTFPIDICRNDCDYFSDFKKYVKD